MPWAADGTVTDPGGDLRDAARRLNDAGQVLLAVPGGGARWQNGQRTSLGDVSLPTDLNEAGLVVGIGPGTADNDFPGFRWNDGVTTVIDLLPPVGNRQAVNLDVNERGQVIGRQCAASAGCRGGALSSFWENGVTTAIPTLGGSRSDVVAIDRAQHHNHATRHHHDDPAHDDHNPARGRPGVQLRRGVGERGTDTCDGGPGRDEARSCETVTAVP